jgi:hypothetical protein
MSGKENIGMSGPSQISIRQQTLVPKESNGIERSKKPHSIQKYWVSLDLRD